MHYLKVYAYRVRRKIGDEGGQFLQGGPAVAYRLMPPGDIGPTSPCRDRAGNSGPS
jgi:hypothetical protein